MQPLADVIVELAAREIEAPPVASNQSGGAGDQHGKYSEEEGLQPLLEDIPAA